MTTEQALDPFRYYRDSFTLIEAKQDVLTYQRGPLRIEESYVGTPDFPRRRADLYIDTLPNPILVAEVSGVPGTGSTIHWTSLGWVGPETAFTVADALAAGAVLAQAFEKGFTFFPTGVDDYAGTGSDPTGTGGQGGYRVRRKGYRLSGLREENSSGIQERGGGRMKVECPRCEGRCRVFVNTPGHEECGCFESIECPNCDATGRVDLCGEIVRGQPCVLGFGHEEWCKPAPTCQHCGGPMELAWPTELWFCSKWVCFAKGYLDYFERKT